jgi:hypothetical protein
LRDRRCLRNDYRMHFVRVSVVVVVELVMIGAMFAVGFASVKARVVHVIVVQTLPSRRLECGRFLFKGLLPIFSMMGDMYRWALRWVDIGWDEESLLLIFVILFLQR